MAASQSARELCSKLNANMVQVGIYGRNERYTVHKAIICAVSQTYQQHFNSSTWNQPSPTSITLNGVNIDVAQTFVQWLYQKRLDRPLNDPWPSSNELLRVYIFATQQSINGLRNDVMDTLQDNIRYDTIRWGISQVHHVLNNTTNGFRGSAIRKFIALYLLWGYTHLKTPKADVKSIFDQCPDILDEYLELQMLYQQYAMQEVPAPWLRVVDRDNKMYCLLHVHGVGETCIRRA